MQKLIDQLAQLSEQINNYKPTAGERGLYNIIRSNINRAAELTKRTSRVKAGGEHLAVLLNSNLNDTKPEPAPLKKGGALLATSDDVKTPAEQLQEIKETAEALKTTKRRRGRPKK